MLNVYKNQQNRQTGSRNLEFPIDKRFTSLVQDHPMITIQLAWWFLTRRFFKFQPMRTHKCEKLTDGRLPMTKAHMAYGQVS